MRSGFQPVARGLAEKPKPGIEGTTRSNASSARAPWDSGSLSGPITFTNSRNEPGQPWVMISGSASACGERTWKKWISSPSISVMNWGSAFNSASSSRQS